MKTVFRSKDGFTFQIVPAHAKVRSVSCLAIAAGGRRESLSAVTGSLAAIAESADRAEFAGRCVGPRHCVGTGRLVTLSHASPLYIAFACIHFLYPHASRPSTRRTCGTPPHSPWPAYPPAIPSAPSSGPAPDHTPTRASPLHSTHVTCSVPDALPLILTQKTAKHRSPPRERPGWGAPAAWRGNLERPQSRRTKKSPMRRKPKDQRCRRSRCFC